MWYVVRAAKEKTMIQKLIEKIQKTKAPICVGLEFLQYGLFRFSW